MVLNPFFLVSLCLFWILFACVPVCCVCVCVYVCVCVCVGVCVSVSHPMFLVLMNITLFHEMMRNYLMEQCGVHGTVWCSWNSVCSVPSYVCGSHGTVWCSWNSGANSNLGTKLLDTHEWLGFDHINRNAPLLIRTAKLTRFEPA